MLLLCWTETARAEMVSVVGDLVNMRTGPGQNYAVLWELGNGYPLQVLEKKGNWMKVEDFENDVGWVHDSVVSRVAHLVVKKNIINIRSGPGEDFKIVRQAEKGVVLRTLDRKGGWVKVIYDEEQITGWVLRTLLWGW